MKLALRIFLFSALLVTPVAVSAQTYDWLRSSGTIPSGAVKGGYEDDGRQTFVCRTRYRGGYIGGKALDDRCYYNAGSGERSTGRFEVLVGNGFSWRNTSRRTRAVSVGGDSETNFYVCRVSVSNGLYPGRTEDGRCYYTRNNRGYSSRRFEILEGSERNASLLSAAGRGDYRQVRDALRDGQAINQRDSSGRTALMLAAEKGYSNVIRELLYERPDVNAQDNRGNTAIIYAARNGKSRVFEDLFRAGADTNMRNEAGETAFVAAAQGGSTEIVRLFLDDSRFGNISETEIASAMVGSAAYGRRSMLTLFIDRGFSPNTRDQRGMTALMAASKGGHEGTVKYLLGLDVDSRATDNSGRSAFVYAIDSDDKKTVRVFFEDFNLVSKTDYEAGEGLRNAARDGKRDSLDYLLKAGVDPNASDDSTLETALMLASEKGNKKVVEELIRYGADVNKQDSNGKTALMLAAANSKNNTTKALIKAKADLEIKDNEGLTALGWAIRNKHGDTRKTLRKAGAKE